MIKKKRKKNIKYNENYYSIVETLSNIENVIIAGGHISGVITGRRYHDCDIFIYGLIFF